MADLQKIADELSSLTVMEAAELSKLLEGQWGVSAAAPVAVVAAGASVAEDSGGQVVHLGLITLDDLVECGKVVPLLRATRSTSSGCITSRLAFRQLT